MSQPDKWHSITAAPQNGTEVILSCWQQNGDGPLFCLWVENAAWIGGRCGGWDLDSALSLRFEPTHWMHLSPPE